MLRSERGRQNHERSSDHGGTGGARSVCAVLARRISPSRDGADPQRKGHSRSRHRPSGGFVAKHRLAPYHVALPDRDFMARPRPPRRSSRQPAAARAMRGAARRAAGRPAPVDLPAPAGASRRGVRSRQAWAVVVDHAASMADTANYARLAVTVLERAGAADEEQPATMTAA